MTADPDNRFSLTIPLGREVIFFVIIFALAAFVRCYQVAADPPSKISFSQDIETDPPQYTVFARSAFLGGDWNPYHDDRYITYQYSLVSAVSRGVYGFFGVGTAQANYVGIMLSLASMVLLYVVVRRGMGNGAALLALFFVAINYLGIFFGRRPFLETGMNSLFLLGLVSLVYFEKNPLGHLCFGICFAASVFFGKIIALGFIGVPVGYYLYRGFLRKETAAWRQAIWMAAGFVVVAAGWYFMIFRPYASSVTGYVSEQAFGLYGAPEGLQSISRFVWKFLSFTKDSEFLDRMPAEGIAAAAAVLLLVSLLTIPSRTKAEGRPALPSALVLLTAWLVSTYLAQMPWNYQPVRYQTAMIFPLSALTAAAIVYFHRSREAVNLLNRSLVFLIGFFILLLLVVYQITAAVVTRVGYEFTFAEYFFYIAIPVAVVMLGYAVTAWKRERWVISMPAVVRYTFIALVVVVALGYHGRNYLAWAGRPLFTTRQASRDLGMILSPGAVLSGPYAPALALENDLGCVINIFGTTRPDSLMFRRYPITHLVLERSNESVMRELYPWLMDKAELICHYYINCRKVSIFRIARQGGNAKAAEYLYSNFEAAIRFYERNREDSGDVYFRRFLKLNPDNLTGNIFAAFFAQSRGQIDSAVEMFGRAVAFSPTDFNLHYLLGKAYIAKADSTGDESWRPVGEREIDLATRFDLGYHDFDDYIGDYVRDSTNEF